MSEIGDNFKYLKKIDDKRKEKNLKSANRDGWIIHTEYHWSRTLNGKRLDYWASRNKFQYEGKVMCGDVDKFIKKRQVKLNKKVEV